MTRDGVRALLLSLPGVEDGVSYGEPSFKAALEKRWRKVAPKRMVKAYDAA
ncbi:hypothetical protein [Brevundimonas sp. SL130]|uniref:hypothetical protein n=1 Tax=Brevundimonas sp. SL130 TaxID=2995143 RepID=UPI00226CDC1F|nr:hypothetical protein [Brevundimonas sp. SL130]WAC61040.1 hypothetical protein OU998_06280 [Brevundimonas sp. SL130]